MFKSTLRRSIKYFAHFLINAAVDSALTRAILTAGPRVFGWVFLGNNAEAESLWGFYRHAFPELSANHILVYRLLWCGALRGEEITCASGLARSTVYVVLRELIVAGLVKKTSHRPVRYSVEEPMKAYAAQCRKVASRLAAGKGHLKNALKGQEGENHEILVRMGKGGRMIMHRGTRSEVRDEISLRELRKLVDERLTEVADGKMRVWALASAGGK